jgi:uncharacterized protein with GYD domain
MPKYVALLSFTGEGMSNIKQSAERVEAAREAVEKVGGSWIGYYVTMGRYDGVAIVDLPSDELAATVVLAIGAQGNVRTETMRAFTLDEFSDIVKNVP